MSVIYGLHAGDGEVRYIGKTSTSIIGRVGKHRSEARKGSKLPVHKWMAKHGPETIQFTILATVEGQAELSALEIKMIAEARPSGRLLNVTDGGEGWLGAKHTDEWKAAASKRRSGFIVSDETKARISASKTGVKINRDPNKSHSPSLEARAKISAALLGRPKPAGHGAKVSAAIRGERHGMSRLDEVDVMAIFGRVVAGEHDDSIAKDYPVLGHTIGKIRRGERWSHVTGLASA